MMTGVATHFDFTLGFKFSEPAQRSQSWHKAIFSAACDYKLRNALQTFSNRFPREGEIDVARSSNRIFILPGAKEDAIIDPLRLNKLELTPKVCANKREHQSPICSIVDHDSFRQRRSISSATADHSM